MAGTAILLALTWENSKSTETSVEDIYFVGEKPENPTPKPPESEVSPVEEVLVVEVGVPSEDTPETQLESLLPLETVTSVENIPLVELKEKSEELQGSLYITLSKKGEEGTYLATLNVASGVIQKIPITHQHQNKNAIPYAASVSPNGREIAFALTDFTNQVSDLFVAPINGGNAVRLTKYPIQAFSGISTPQWKSEGSLIFSYKESPPTFTNEEELREYQEEHNLYEVKSTTHIVEISREGVIGEITNGFFPQIYPNGNLLYSLEDGLFVHRAEDNKAQRVVVINSPEGEPIQARLNKKLSLSPKGTYLAWSNFDRGEIYIFKSEEKDNTYYLQPYARYPVSGFWAVFSPDENYLAIQTAQRQQDSGPSNAEVVIYNLEEHTIAKTHKLHEYKQTEMWLTDWTY